MQQVPKTLGVDEVVGELKASGIDFVVAVPDSRLNKLQSAIRQDPHFTLIEVTNEGEGIAICAGAWMVGRRPAMLMEDTGIYEGALPLEKFGNMGEIPMLLLVAYHGPIGEGNWFQVSRTPLTMPLLDALRIPHVTVYDSEDLREGISGAVATMSSSKRPAAVLFGRYIL